MTLLPLVTLPPRGGSEGNLPKEVMALDGLVKLDLKDNCLTGERGESVAFVTPVLFSPYA